MKFTLNNKTYETKKINFGAMVELEELGFEFANIQTKILTSITCLVAYHCGFNKEEACKEIEEHLSHGGKFDDLIPIVTNFIESDFFQKIH